MSPEVERSCGTYAGYQTHKRNDEPQCQPCRAANAEYTRSLRRSSTQLADKERLDRRARRRALTRLAREYRARFLDLYNEELAKEVSDAPA